MKLYQFYCSYLFLFFLYLTSFHYSYSQKPYEDNIFIKQGKKYYTQKNYKKAFLSFQKAIENKTNRGEPYFFIGMIHDARKEYKKSIDSFQESLSFPLENKYREISLWKLIYYYDKIKDYHNLLKHIELLEEENISTPNLNNLKEKAIVNSHFHSQEKDKEYQEAKKLFYKYLTFYNNLKLKMQSSKKYNDKKNLLIHLGYLRSAIKLNNKLSNYALSAGILLDDLEEYELAREFYLLVKDKKLKPKVYYKIGLIEKKKNLFKKSIHYLKKVLSYKNISKDIRNYTYLNIAQSMIGLQRYKSSYKYIEKNFNLNTNQLNIINMTYCIGYSKSIMFNKNQFNRFHSKWKQVFADQNEIKNLQISEKSSPSLQNKLSTYFFCKNLYEHFHKEKNRTFSNEKIRLLNYYFLFNWEYFHNLILKNNNIYQKFRTNFLNFYFPNNQQKIIQNVFDTSNISETPIKNTPWLFQNIQETLSLIYKSKDYSIFCAFKYTFYSHIKWNIDLLLETANTCEKIKKYNFALYFYKKIQHSKLNVKKKILEVLLVTKNKNDFIEELKDYFFSIPHKYHKEIIKYLSTDKKFHSVYTSLKLLDWFQEIK